MPRQEAQSRRRGLFRKDEVTVALRWVREERTEEGAAQKGLEVSLEVRVGHGSSQVLGSRQAGRTRRLGSRQAARCPERVAG